MAVVLLVEFRNIYLFILLSEHLMKLSSIAMFIWILATVAWPVLKLRMEETASSYGGQLQLYQIIIRWK
jgi:hypothetical protein